MRLQQRGLTAATLCETMETLEIIGGSVFHPQIGTDVEGENIRVVTMYIPDPDEWDEGFRSRRIK